jgi:hypothetical protein
MSIFNKLLSLFSKPEVQAVSATNGNQNEKKYTTTMVNSVTLSSDMKTLFLIDNGRAISFPLDIDKGILIGTLKGQITVATGFEVVRETEGESLPGTGEVEPVTLSATRGHPQMPSRFVVPITGNQWTVAFIAKHEALAVVGATDIDIALTGDTGGLAKPNIVFFRLKEAVLHVRLFDNKLYFSLLASK